MAEVNVEAIEKFALSKKDRPKALFSKVGIVGFGTVGQNIGIMISSKEIEVIFVEINEEKIQQSLQEITQFLDDKINHWGMTEGEKRTILSRIKGTTDYNQLKGCDLVIEAILSKIRELSLDIRKGVFKKIEEHVDKETIIATNSTTIVITELSSELKYKDRCISLHFSTTAPDAKVVEIVRGIYTSEEVCQNVRKFTKLIKKIPIAVQESPGLISVRLFAVLISEACDVYLEGVSSVEDIDYTMKNGMGLPLGPFEMADKIGLDKVVRWMENLYKEFGEVKYKPSPVLKKLYRANYLGRKTGRGFYRYDENGQKITN